MASFHESMSEYRRLLQKGDLQQAYRGLMEYLMGLRTYFQSRYSAYFVSGSLYAGYMDMSYFSFTPASLKQRGLKIAIVFVHETFRFEVWLGGNNKQVQAKYWKLFQESGWDRYHVVPTTKGMDSIVEHVLAAEPDFGDLEALTQQIEAGTMEFIRGIENFLTEHF